MLVLTCGGGVVAGVLLARLYLRLTAAVTDIPISIVLQFISTFAVWILAERIGLSAIITVVCYAMTLARHVPARMDASSRIASYVVWEVMVFVLNVLAFVLIGLQLRGIVTRLDPAEWRIYGIVRNRRVRGGDRDAHRLVDVAQHDRAVADPPLRREAAPPHVSPDARQRPHHFLVRHAGHRHPGRRAGAAREFSAPRSAPALRLCGRADHAGACRGSRCAGSSSGSTCATMASSNERSASRGPRRPARRCARSNRRILRRPSRCAGNTRRACGRPRTAPRATKRRTHRSSPSCNCRVVAEQRKTLLDLRGRDVIGDSAFQAVEAELDLVEISADSRVRP